jgi:hypothetical protein
MPSTNLFVLGSVLSHFNVESLGLHCFDPHRFLFDFAWFMTNSVRIASLLKSFVLSKFVFISILKSFALTMFVFVSILQSDLPLLTILDENPKLSKTLILYPR